MPVPETALRLLQRAKRRYPDLDLSSGGDGIDHLNDTLQEVMTDVKLGLTNIDFAQVGAPNGGPQMYPITQVVLKVWAVEWIWGSNVNERRQLVATSTEAMDQDRMNWRSYSPSPPLFYFRDGQIITPTGSESAFNDQISIHPAPAESASGSPAYLGGPPFPYYRFWVSQNLTLGLGDYAPGNVRSIETYVAGICAYHAADKYPQDFDARRAWFDRQRAEEADFWNGKSPYHIPSTRLGLSIRTYPNM